MQDKPVRIAVIGVGYFGKFHARKYSQMPDVDLVGVVDTCLETAQNVAREVGAPFYTDYRDILQKVDAVDICVPTQWHYSIAKDFLHEGADVFIEKPITVTCEEADELIALAAKTNRILQVGHLEWFNPALMAVQDMLKEPYLIEAFRQMPYHGRGMDVSVVLDLMIHDIDLILGIIQDMPHTIYATGNAFFEKNTSDTAGGTMVFENGCVARLLADRVSAVSRREMTLFQENGSVTIDFMNRVAKTAFLNEDPKITMRVQEFDEQDALLKELEHFVSCIYTRTTPVVTAQMARNALAVALSMITKTNSF